MSRPRPTAPADAKTRVVIHFLDTVRKVYVQFERDYPVAPAAFATRTTSDLTEALAAASEALREIVASEICYAGGMFPCAACGEPAQGRASSTTSPGEPLLILHISVPTCPPCMSRNQDFIGVRFEAMLKGAHPRDVPQSVLANRSDVFPVLPHDLVKVTARILAGVKHKVAVEKTCLVYLPRYRYPAELAKDNINEVIAKQLSPYMQRFEIAERRILEDKRDTKLPCVGCGGFSVMQVSSILARKAQPGKETGYDHVGVIAYAPVCISGNQKCSPVAKALVFDSTRREPGPRSCDNCHRFGEGQAELKRCSGCHKAIYCSPKCQKVNWKEHKEICKVLQRAGSE